MLEWHVTSGTKRHFFDAGSSVPSIDLPSLQPTWPLKMDVGSDLGGGFKYFLFSPLFREDSQFDEHIFQMGWFNHQPEMNVLLGQPFAVKNCREGIECKRVSKPSKLGGSSHDLSGG